MDLETPLEETMGALDQIVRSGKALYVGLSNYNGKTMKKACQILTDEMPVYHQPGLLQHFQSNH